MVLFPNFFYVQLKTSSHRNSDLCAIEPTPIKWYCAESEQKIFKAQTQWKWGGGLIASSVRAMHTAQRQTQWARLYRVAGINQLAGKCSLLYNRARGAFCLLDRNPEIPRAVLCLRAAFSAIKIVWPNNLMHAAHTLIDPSAPRASIHPWAPLYKLNSLQTPLSLLTFMDALRIIIYNCDVQVLIMAVRSMIYEVC